MLAGKHDDFRVIFSCAEKDLLAMLSYRLPLEQRALAVSHTALPLRLSAA